VFSFKTITYLLGQIFLILPENRLYILDISLGINNPYIAGIVSLASRMEYCNEERQHLVFCEWSDKGPGIHAQNLHCPYDNAFFILAIHQGSDFLLIEDCTLFIKIHGGRVNYASFFFFPPTFHNLNQFVCRIWQTLCNKKETWDDKYLFILTGLSHVCMQAVCLFETKN
jgi:hypothetical protein